MPQKLVTKRQTAEMLAVSPRTIDRWDAAGKLPRAIRIGDRTYGPFIGPDTRGAKRWRLADILEAFPELAD